MNRSASSIARLAGSSLWSTGPILESEPGEQDSDPALGRIEILLAASQRRTEVCKFCMQGLAITVTGVVADEGAAGRPDLHQAFSGEHPNGGLGCVQRDPVGIPQLPVRRHAATRWAIPAADLGPQGICEPVTRKTVCSLRHMTTITDRPNTDTHCRQRVGVDFSTPADNCPRAVGARPGPTRVRPAQRCPCYGTELDYGPAVFR